MNDKLAETRLSGEMVFDGRLLKVYNDEILLPNGETSRREYIKHVGAACVIPVTDDKRVAMVKQYRYPVGMPLLEIPAGKLDGKNEDPLNAAVRELKEETGAVAEKMTYLGKFYPTPAYTDEVIHMYLATGLDFGNASPDEDEFLEICFYSLEELVKMVLNGQICDGKTKTAILLADRILNK